MLKTLKEIRGGSTVHRKDLKQEAIKWLKADTIDLYEVLGIEPDSCNLDLKTIDLILTKFCNISEEDLK